MMMPTCLSLCKSAISLTTSLVPRGAIETLFNVTQVRFFRPRHTEVNRYPFYPKGTPQPAAHTKHSDPTRPRLDIAYTGSVYDTKIKRRTEIRNYNEPIDPIFFERVTEQLKWTDWRMKRDVNKRRRISEYWPVRQNLVCVKINWLLPEELRTQAYKDVLLKLPIATSVTHYNNRCMISSRCRGRVRKFRLGRFFFRHFSDYNLLSGVLKAKWGP